MAKEKLHQDLEKKLDRLRWTLEQPELFIVENFTSIRNEIDLDTERLIYELGNDESHESTLKVNGMNSTRNIFIQFLDKMELRLLEKLLNASRGSNEYLIELEKRVKEFSEFKEFSNANEIEEAYLQLALDIIDTTNGLEGRLLDNRTIAFKRSLETNQMGSLVYLSEDFLNRDELACLKIGECKYPTLIRETIEASFNNSLSVGLSRPFVITKNMLIIVGILDHFNSTESSTGKIVYLESSSRIKQDFPIDEDASFYQAFNINMNGILDNTFGKSVEAVQLGDMPSKYFSNPKAFYLNIYGSMLRRYQLCDSLILPAEELTLSHNQLEELDEEQLAKATNIQQLILVGACLPDTRFSLSFLPSLTELFQLNLTLPNAPIDFNVFMNLQKVQYLELHSAASLDSNIERPQLTQENFKQLSVMSQLTTLELSYFKIETLEQNMLSVFPNVFHFYLNDNQINCMGENSDSDVKPKAALRLKNNSIGLISAHQLKGLTRGGYLDLGGNQIEQLPAGVFAWMEEIITITLDHNSIRHIPRGVFNELEHLDTLVLDNNLIESIEANPFDSSWHLLFLSLADCKLKSIDNKMFSGMVNLLTLTLDNNEIAAFEVVNEASKRSTFRGILSPYEYVLVRENLFCGMTELTRLSLKGNRLEKIDFNIFCNLAFLEEIDLSKNCINELNEEIRPGVLPNLTVLDLSENQLTRCSRRAFSESVRLEELRLTGNKLKSLEEDFFEPFAELKQAELQDNQLTINITPRTLARCARLVEINLLNNASVTVEDGAFSTLQNLKKIKLEMNAKDATWTEISMKQQQNLLFFAKAEKLALVNCFIENLEFMGKETRFSNLKELNLTKNRIKHLCKQSWLNMPVLEHLNLSQNMIECLDDPTLFLGLENLKLLDLSGNTLMMIDRKLFKGLHKLESIDLSRNPTLTPIDAGIFRGLFNLKNLKMAGNNIVSFDLASLFRSCRALECLDLSNNQLDNESINETSMSGSTAQNLKQLMLANNRLKRMDFIRRLCRLEKLDLSGNKIESVSSNGVNLFGRLVELKHVDLSDNEIKSIDVEAVFSHLKNQLEFFDMSRNPFNMNSVVKCTKNFHLFVEKCC